MKVEGSFSWKSNLMEIISVEKKYSLRTEKHYMVVKAEMVFFGNPVRRGIKNQKVKVHTMLCFKESLFALFEAGNYHIFEGEISFDWGNTWLKIMRLYDDSGNRLLRPYKNNCQYGCFEASPALPQEPGALEIAKELEEEQAKDDFSPCEQECISCLDVGSNDCPLY